MENQIKVVENEPSVAVNVENTSDNTLMGISVCPDSSGNSSDSSDRKPRAGKSRMGRVSASNSGIRKAREQTDLFHNKVRRGRNSKQVSQQKAELFLNEMRCQTNAARAKKNSFSRLPMKSRTFLYKQFIDDIVHGKFMDAQGQVITADIEDVKRICETFEVELAKQKSPQLKDLHNDSQIVNWVIRPKHAAQTHEQKGLQQFLNVVPQTEVAANLSLGTRKLRDVAETMDVDLFAPAKQVMQILNVNRNVATIPDQIKIEEMFRVWLSEKYGMICDILSPNKMDVETPATSMASDAGDNDIGIKFLENFRSNAPMYVNQHPMENVKRSREDSGTDTASECSDYNSDGEDDTMPEHERPLNLSFKNPRRKRLCRTIPTQMEVCTVHKPNTTTGVSYNCLDGDAKIQKNTINTRHLLNQERAYGNQAEPRNNAGNGEAFLSFRNLQPNSAAPEEKKMPTVEPNKVMEPMNDNRGECRSTWFPKVAVAVEPTDTTLQEDLIASTTAEDRRQQSTAVSSSGPCQTTIKTGDQNASTSAEASCQQSTAVSTAGPSQSTPKSGVSEVGLSNISAIAQVKTTDSFDLSSLQKALRPISLATPRSKSSNSEAQNSQLWISVGQFTATAIIDQVNADKLAVLSALFSEAYSYAGSMNFGVDQERFSDGEPEKLGQLLSKVPTVANVSQYWFAVGDLLMYFSGAAVSEERKRDFIRYVRDAQGSSGNLFVGVDRYEFTYTAAKKYSEMRSCDRPDIAKLTNVIVRDPSMCWPPVSVMELQFNNLSIGE